MKLIVSTFLVYKVKKCLLKSGKVTFFEVIEKYQPQYIIVWGKRLWNNLPGGHWRQEQISDVHWVDCNDMEVEGTWVPNGFYMMPGGKHVKALVVNHPSVGYSWDYWYKVIQRFLR